MHNDDLRPLVEHAARATMARIRHDGEMAPERLKVLFAYLERQLFERGLDVNQMKRACGKRNNSVSSHFADVTGQSPHAYIVARRVETAATLLRDTDLEIRIIARLLGFSKHGLLTRNFKAYHKMTPRDYRLIMRRKQADPWRTEFSARKQELPKPITLSMDRENIEEIKLDVIWEMLKEKPLVAQRDLIQNRLSFSTPAFFHFLRKKSIPEGRTNREFGIHLSELAIECLRVTEKTIGEVLFDLHAQGWSWMANARRLADDLSGAEAAFSIAEAYLAISGESLVQAEYLGQKATLRLWQGRIDEASRLSGRSLSIFRAKGKPREVTRSLIEGASILERAGEDSESVIYLTEAMKLLSADPEPYLELVAAFNLTNAYVKIGAFESAMEIFPRLFELKEKANAGEASLYHILWLEGRINDGLCELSAAVCHYRAAREGLLRLGKGIEAAIVSLDLALNCWKQEKSIQVRELTLEVIPILESIQYHTEAAAGLKLLQSAIEKDALTREVLQDAREYVKRIQVDSLA